MLIIRLQAEKFNVCIFWFLMPTQHVVLTNGCTHPIPCMLFALFFLAYATYFRYYHSCLDNLISTRIKFNYKVVTIAMGSKNFLFGVLSGLEEY